MPVAIPSSLKTEHEALHQRLVQATREPGNIGKAAGEVARLLHPHFVKEEENALPPLGALVDLARGELTASDIPELLRQTAQLERDWDAMLAEHQGIVGALDELRAAARAEGRPEYEAFAEALALHARTEEEVLYPAAILVGKHLLALSRADAAATLV